MKYKVVFEQYRYFQTFGLNIDHRIRCRFKNYRSYLVKSNEEFVRRIPRNGSVIGVVVGIEQIKRHECTSDVDLVSVVVSAGYSGRIEVHIVGSMILGRQFKKVETFRDDHGGGSHLDWDVLHRLRIDSTTGDSESDSVEDWKWIG
jgi:hypothetical protein